MDDGQASVYDVAPTVATLLGIPGDPGWQGSPLPGAPAAVADPGNPEQQCQVSN